MKWLVSDFVKTAGLRGKRMAPHRGKPFLRHAGEGPLLSGEKCGRCEITLKAEGFRVIPGSGDLNPHKLSSLPHRPGRRHTRLAVLLTLMILTGTIKLDTASATEPPTRTFASAFVQTRTLPGFDSPLISHGIMRFDPAHGFRWEITAPYHYVFEMRDGRAQEQLPDGSTRAFDPDQAPWLAAVQHIFISALTGDRHELERYFTVVIKPLAGKGRQIVLTPKAGALSKAIRRIEVVEAAPGQPRTLDIAETSGGHMSLRFEPIATHP